MVAVFSVYRLALKRAESLPQGATIKAEAKFISWMSDPALLGFRLYILKCVQKNSSVRTNPLIGNQFVFYLLHSFACGSMYRR